MSRIKRAAKALLLAAWDALPDDRKPGRSVIAPGGEVAWDNCCDGQLSVRIISAVTAYDRGQKCVTGIKVTYGVAIVRCVQSLDDRGRPPTEEQITDDGFTMIDDMCALHAGIETTDLGHRTVIGSWTPSGPMGGCAGGEWTVEMYL